MTEERIIEILDMLKNHATHNYWEVFSTNTDVWGCDLPWGYNVTYLPQTQIYFWQDTEDVGFGAIPVTSSEISEKELIEKLRKIQKN
ncbi:MAG: hypothetical protein ACKVTZ_14925 [Bacteroidia bacterium]